MMLFPSGTPNLGEPATTTTLRAFDIETGTELWHDTLPSDGMAGAISYQSRGGGQYIVIAARKHGAVTHTPLEMRSAPILPKRV
jgi:glucose dehydrogenase